ncbi:hypothetical protein J7K74_03820 [Candidatus Woesearchaeota archaeon]|nr:hypothetical protein [Candidatus Woesearchaeota archaeon]
MLKAEEAYWIRIIAQDLPFDKSFAWILIGEDDLEESLEYVEKKAVENNKYSEILVINKYKNEMLFIVISPDRGKKIVLKAKIVCEEVVRI